MEIRLAGNVTCWEWNFPADWFVPDSAPEAGHPFRLRANQTHQQLKRATRLCDLPLLSAIQSVTTQCRQLQ